MAATLSPALAAWLFLLALSTATPVAQAQTNAAALAPEVASGRTEKTIGFGRRDLVVAAHPLAVEAGVETVIAHGRLKGMIAGAVAGDDVGTRFPVVKRRATATRRRR